MTYQYPIKRTPEEGHTPACWTKAITVALENQRDYMAEYVDDGKGLGDLDFRVWLQDNGPLRMAEDLLADGSTVCLCEPISMGFFDQFEHMGKD